MPGENLVFYGTLLERVLVLGVSFAYLSSVTSWRRHGQRGFDSQHAQSTDSPRAIASIESRGAKGRRVLHDTLMEVCLFGAGHVVLCLARQLNIRPTVDATTFNS